MADPAVSNEVISDGYREMQKSLHKSSVYGETARKYSPIVAAIIEESGVTEVLDYGSGKGGLRESLSDYVLSPVDVTDYDPAIAGIDELAPPSELVVCIDVLEHIEPDLLDNVLDDLDRVTRNLLFMTINCGPARKYLPDGRNAHLIQEDMRWWLSKLMDRFGIHSLARTNLGFWVICYANNDTR